MKNGQHSKIGFFVQARTSSTRLPGKTMLPFYQGKTILQLIIERLLDRFPDIPVFLLTTTNPKDTVIVEQFQDYPLTVFRGDEDNVLKRFTDAATEYGIQDIIRICSDNPFILPEFVEELVEHPMEGLDYLSHSFEQIPAMKCHFGFFAERVKADSLKKAAQSTMDKLYLEHVTNFVYSNPEQFHVQFIETRELLKDIRFTRLTIDTEADFKLASSLYEEVSQSGQLNLQRVIEGIALIPDLSQKMHQQQQINQK